MTRPRLSQIAQTGATAWQIPVWNNTTGQWEPASASVAGALLAANNLSDVAAPATARTNLGLGTAATANTGTTNGTIPLLGANNTVPTTLLGTGTPAAGQYVDGGTGAWTNVASGYTDPLTTKGDLVARSTATVRQPVGADGQVLTADSTQATGIKWAAPPAAAVAARAYRETAFSMPTGAVTVIPLDGESFDTGTMHDNVTNSSRITVPQAGKYVVTGQVALLQVSGQVQARILKNGVMVTFAAFTSATVTDYYINFGDLLSLIAGDYIEMAAYQSSGAAVNIDAQSLTTFLSVSLMGT